MTTLLRKEIRLVAHPTSIVFAFLGCLVLVPSYPYMIPFPLFNPQTLHNTLLLQVFEADKGNQYCENK